MGPGQGFSQVCMIAGAGILSTTPEVLSVRQGTGLWMARGANSHCHLPALAHKAAGPALVTLWRGPATHSPIPAPGKQDPAMG